METQTQAEKVIIGRIVGLFGVRGWLKIQSYTEPRENIMEYSPWMLCIDGEWRTFQVDEVQPHGKGIVAKLADVADRDEAAALLRSDIAIERQQLPPLAESEYYWRDLQGLRVVNLAGSELGIVDHLLETGANDVLVVRQGENELLIPFVVEQVIKTVDLAGGQIQVDWEADY